MLTISRRYDLEVAHHLTAGVPDGHKCRRLHGHRYELTIWVGGPFGHHGMLVEYADLDRVVMPVLKLLDHHDANSLSERCSTSEAEWVSANPTVEYLALWLAARLVGIVASAVPDRKLRLERLRLQEDAQSAAEWSLATAEPQKGGDRG